MILVCFICYKISSLQITKTIITQEDNRAAYGKQPINFLTLLAGRVIHLTCTERSDELQSILLREATKHETHYYVFRIGA